MKILISFLGIYSAFILLIYYYQKNLLFFPDQTTMDNCPEIQASGGEVHQSSNNISRFYWIKTKQEQPKGWLVHFHGNAGRACDRFSITKKFLDLGYHLVLAEYPGYAEDSTLPSEASIMKSASEVYRSILAMNDHNLPIILFGESLGTAPVTYLAAKNLPHLSGLILQTPFPSIAAVGQSHYFYLPVFLLLKDKFSAHEWAPTVKVPVFIFHGDQDEVIPYRLGLEQSKNFPPDQLTFQEIKGAHHNDLWFFGEQIWKGIENFLSDINMDK